MASWSLELAACSLPMMDRARRRLLLFLIITLISFGCVMVYSTTAIMAYETYGQPLRFVMSHLLAIGIGGIVALGCLATPFSHLRRSAKMLVGISLVLLVLVDLFGFQVGGARRWFRLGGFGLQPSEFAKPALVLYLADFLARKRDVVHRFRDGFLPPMLITGLLALLVLVQPDLGNALVLGAVALVLLVIAKARWKHVGLTAGLGTAALAVLIMSKGYRRRRMLAFLDPWQDPQGAGFQILQSYLALANGGFFGRGLGASMQKLFYLPGAHTDFIFAIIAEELGLIGTTVLLGLFALFVACGIRMAYTIEDAFSKYVLCGCVALI
ncbi:MAG: cell division protein FtsW, partial [Candidatus Omnitrophica bacterium]|nr:cell division protein FtsW [Candidatus Omnitrophota bacterium]